MIDITQVNYTFSPGLPSGKLLELYGTLTGWAEALTCAGANVTVVQRFETDGALVRNGVQYQFVQDSSRRHGSLIDSPLRLHRAVAESAPGVIHAHGLQFARQAAQLKELLPHVPILIQDHANTPPRHPLVRWRLKRALARMDGVCFVSTDQARPWQDAGLIRQDQIVELMESSSRFRLLSRDLSRAQAGLRGDPLCLWVGRLNGNKDPLTVLDGFAAALPTMPDAALAMVYSEDDLLASVEAWLAEHPAAAPRISLLGKLPHEALEAVFNSADFFLLGSHHEGSGYAVLEALSCGVTPVVTDIPSFRVLTGRGTIGALWAVGNSAALYEALSARHATLHPGARLEVRSYFDKHFSWDAIAGKAIAEYRRLIDSTR